MTPRAPSIRAWLRKGFDTVSLARRWDCAEADLWNVLASELSPSAPLGADRLAHGRAVSAPPKTTSPRASVLGAFGQVVVGRSVHAELDAGDTVRRKAADLGPVSGINHVFTSPGASGP